MKIRKDGTKRNRFFEKLVVKTQSEMKEFLAEELKRRGREVEVGDGYIYSKGDVPIILAAHMDTVHEEVVSEIVYENGRISSPQGIGGDDRCGIYMILKVIKKYNCHVLFFEDEEIGGVGSEKFTKTETCVQLMDKVNYVIELDRMNSKDAVYYQLDNPEFQDFVEKEFWKTAYGSFTDICHICPALGVAGVNLSCGYYKQHTFDEYVVLSEMETAIEEVKKLIARTKENDVFEYIEYDYYEDDWWFGRYRANFQRDMKEKLYEIAWEEDGVPKYDEVSGITAEEAIGNFVMVHDNVRYRDIEYVVEIKDVY